jgi:hypothetical protein
MLTEKGISETFESLKAGDYIEFELDSIDKCKFQPYDMCVVHEMGIDEGEKARKETEIDVGNMFRFTGNKYDIVIAGVDKRGRATYIGIVHHFIGDVQQPANPHGIIICPVLSWSDMAQMSLDGISKVIPSFMVAVPRSEDDLSQSNSVAVGMAVFRCIRVGK